MYLIFYLEEQGIFYLSYSLPYVPLIKAVK
jgi:hypothetical protein